MESDQIEPLPLPPLLYLVSLTLSFSPLLSLSLLIPQHTHITHTHITYTNTDTRKHWHTHNTRIPTRTVMLIGIHACCTKANLRTAVVDMIAAGKYGRSSLLYDHINPNPITTFLYFIILWILCNCRNDKHPLFSNHFHIYINLYFRRRQCFFSDDMKPTVFHFLFIMAACKSNKMSNHLKLKYLW